MIKKKRTISKRKKLEVLNALSMAECNVSAIAKLHGISRSIIYKWQKEMVKNTPVFFTEQSQKNENNFVECSLAVAEKASLQKASLCFRDFSISIEGIFSNAQLIAILNSLEV